VVFRFSELWGVLPWIRFMAVTRTVARGAGTMREV
jgi:hypothetical protein